MDTVIDHQGEMIPKKEIIQNILHLALESSQGHSVTRALGLTWSLVLGPLQIPLHTLWTGRGPGVMG